MSNFQSALVQFGYYGSYSTLATSDTGVELITADAVDGVESEDEAFGVRNCWG